MRCVAWKVLAGTNCDWLGLAVTRQHRNASRRAVHVETTLNRRSSLQMLANAFSTVDDVSISY